ncbi:MAG: triple tyrosine motif-containing protein [Ignavibacteriales bacterium]|nr:triple tyrosine motif-containing protein [Ignavibacteriales bacterium]
MTHSKNTYFRSIIFIVVLIVCTVSSALALDPQKTINQYGHNVWLKQNGLPANAVNVGLQGRDGYLWLGTSAGLFRFDGVNFTPVNTNPKDSKVIETISTLCFSRDSNLWVGTTFSNLRRIKNEKIFRYSGADGLLSREIQVLLESKIGHIWVGTTYGLFMYAGGKFISVPINPRYITSLTEDSLGRIWVGTHEGVRIFDDVRMTQVGTMTIANGLPHDITTTLFTDRDSNVWVGTVNGLVRWKNGALKTYKWSDGIHSDHITSVCEDRDNNLWFGTYKGINRLTKGTWSSMTYLYGLTNDHVLNIFEDHEGSIWVCTLEGLNQYTDVNITSYTTKEGLASDYISGIAETPDSTLYILSNADGVIMHMKNGRTIIDTANVGPAYVARDGSLWISQTGLLLNIKNNRIKRFTPQTGLPNKWFSAITEDSVSLILYVDGIGLQRFVDGRLKPYLLKNGEPYHTLEYVACLYSQLHGPLWIGSTNGLVKIENGSSTMFKQTEGLAGPWVNCILDDQLGSLWITSPSDGLTRYNNGKLTPLSIKDGLFTSEFYCVLCDNEGDLWLSSPSGIIYLKRADIDDYQAGKIKTLHSQVYVTADGMKTDECFGGWQPVGWKTHDGCLWFATKKGAVKIDPKIFKRNTFPPPVIIERVMVDQETMPADQFTIFSPGKEKWEFHFTALSLLVPHRVLFKYKLEGYDREWVEAGTRRVAYYTNLPSGQYRFRVIACNNDGVWNKVGANFTFNLQPHFYEAYWFYGLVLIVLGGAIFGAYRVRVWQLLKREKELQQGIQEALASVKTLSGLLPICANCKKIRNDKGYWDQIEGYIQKHSEAQFTHGICPECAKELYSDVVFENNKINKSA